MNCAASRLRARSSLCPRIKTGAKPATSTQISDSIFRQPRGYEAAFSRRDASEVWANFCPSEGRGRRESRVHAAPAVSRANTHSKTHTSIQVQRRQSGLPCAVVYGLLRALPGDRAFLPPSLVELPPPT